MSAEVPLALTMGDPAGIGIELAISVWCHRHTSRCPPFVFFGDPSAVDERAQRIGTYVRVSEVSDPAAGVEAFDDTFPVIPAPLAAPAVCGRPDPRNATAVIGAIEAATAAIADGGVSAIVTNPIAKSVLYASGFSHPGHTEFLGELAQRFWGNGPFDPVMLLASDVLRVVPLTVHIPVADVPASVTPERLVSTTRILAAALQRDFGIARPRIAVAGLNPHAGESGTIGTEERDVIAPTLETLRAEGIDVAGPLSADTMFHDEARAHYDAAIAMYHDQALIPIKTLAFDRGVNVTLGLPFVRTSPDHGTAFDIAGKGCASSRSLLEALRLAQSMAERRRDATAAGRSL